jgi:hypothetical protein
MSDLSSELRQMAEDAARQARPPAAAEIIWQGDRRRRRSLTRQSLGALSVAGAAGAGVALGLGLTGAVAPHDTGTIQTTAFTLVKNANGTATLTINAGVLFQPGTLQSDLEQDGIPAKVTVGSLCSSDPVPAGTLQVVSVQKPKHRGPGNLPHVAQQATQGTGQEQSQHSGQPAVSGGGTTQTITINPAAIPAGTELSFGNFQLTNGEQTYFTLIDTGSYTCTSTAPANPPQGIYAIGFAAQSSSSTQPQQG